MTDADPTAPRERPILFSAPMVLAILAGRKTQTRRVVKPQPGWDGSHFVWKGKRGTVRWSGDKPEACALVHGLRPECPFGPPGSRLWVRETFAKAGEVGDEIEYRADNPDPTSGKWRPSIFMPRWASRLALEVTGVRVERLQDISDADARAEGVTRVKGDLFGVEGAVEFCHHYPQDAYADLWRSINGDDSWKANPWVWVVEFKRLEAK